jgi:hypothetical protein
MRVSLAQTKALIHPAAPRLVDSTFQSTHGPLTRGTNGHRLEPIHDEEQSAAERPQAKPTGPAMGGLARLRRGLCDDV